MSTDEKQETDRTAAFPGRAERISFAGLHAVTTEKILALFSRCTTNSAAAFPESVYQQALRIAPEQAGLRVKAEVAVPVLFRGQAFDREQEGQILHYLRATNPEVGFLPSFGPRPQFKRFILENEKKEIRVHPRSSVVGLREAER